jgi:hypothetical protein
VMVPSNAALRPAGPPPITATSCVRPVFMEELVRDDPAAASAQVGCCEIKGLPGGRTPRASAPRLQGWSGGDPACSDLRKR